MYLQVKVEWIIRQNLVKHPMASVKLLKNTRNLALLWQDIKNMRICDFAHCSLFGIESHSISGQLYLGSNYWISLPGCGLYEGRNSTLRGEFKEAFQIHPFIYVIAALLVLFVLFDIF